MSEQGRYGTFGLDGIDAERVLLSVERLKQFTHRFCRRFKTSIRAPNFCQGLCNGASARD